MPTDTNRTASTNISSTSVTDAKAIMGTNFYSLASVQRLLNRKFSAKERELLAIVPFSARLLAACRDSHLLVACAPLSVAELQAQAIHAFRRRDQYYAYGHFAEETARIGWYLICKDAAPDSTHKSWAAQAQLCASDEFIPTSPVLVLAVLVHYLETNECLLRELYVRTNDEPAPGSHTIVGCFNRSGLGVLKWDDLSIGGIGVVTAKLPS